MTKKEFRKSWLYEDEPNIKTLGEMLSMFSQRAMPSVAKNATAQTEWMKITKTGKIVNSCSVYKKRFAIGNLFFLPTSCIIFI